MEVSWPTLLEAIETCRKCRLCETRRHTVPGEGNPRAELLFIGEGPGQEEDMLGRPFVGAAGRLLEKMLAAISLTRNDVYIANVVKCRPPYNRTPQADEVTACMPYLRAQTALIRPKVIVLLGASAGKAVLGDQLRITRDRGEWVRRKDVWMMPTFHPAALLRDESKKRFVWEDLQRVRDKLAERGE